MIIVLPKIEQFEAFERSLTVERLAEIIRELQPTGMRLVMPKFSYTSEYDLTSTLMGLGMPAAFSAEADFSGMNGRRDLFISQVVHKAFVAVDEEGTEAAAATGVIMPTAAPATEIRIDHPFLYLIRDNETGTILFWGRVLSPAD